MLAYADELKNIARACRLAGVSRSHFYEIKQAYETFGREGLVPQVRRKPRMPNQTPSELERQILTIDQISNLRARCTQRRLVSAAYVRAGVSNARSLPSID